MRRRPFLLGLLLILSPLWLGSAHAADSQWASSYSKTSCVVMYKTRPDGSQTWRRALSLVWMTTGQFGFLIQDQGVAAGAQSLPLEIVSATGSRFSGDARPFDPKDPTHAFWLDISGRKDLERSLLGDMTFKYAGEYGQSVSVTVPFGMAVPRTEACVANAASLAAIEAGGRERAPGRDGGSQASDSPDPTLIATGSGVAVNLTGNVLTNAHVVEGCGRVVSPALGAARVLAVDKASDLALLSFATRPAGAVSFRTGALKLGEAVLVAGYPLSDVLQNGLNVTTGNLSALAGPEGDRRMIQFTAPVQHGNSGGPLVDHSARLMGLVSARAPSDLQAENINWAVALSVIQSFLDENSVAYELGKEAALAPEQIASRARTFTVPLECRK